MMRKQALNFIFGSVKIIFAQLTLMIVRIAALIFLLLLSLSTQTRDNYNQYDILPNLPPTAYIGQYYTVKFRVSGLTTPIFTFKSLPSCFTTTDDGTLEGTPNKVGSFSIVVSYQSGADYGQKSIVLRVAQPNKFPAIPSKKTAPQNLNWVLLVPNLYQVGDKISINLNKYVKKAYNWSYIQLPEQLEGDVNGNIVGIIYDEGYYSYGVTYSDIDGNSWDFFFTLNIQPLYYSSYGRRTCVEVPNRNVFKYSLEQLQNLQNQASLNLLKALKVATQASNDVGQAKADIATTQSSLEMAHHQVEAVQKVVSLALNEKAKQYNLYNIADTKLDKAKGIAEIKKTAYQQATNRTNYIQSVLNAANKLFYKITEIFKALNQKFIDAQNGSTQAAADLAVAQKAVGLAKDDVKNTFSDVLEAKKILQKMKDKSIAIDFNVSIAADAKDVANFQNDASTAAYNIANSQLQKALLALQSANSTVYQLQQQKNEAKNYLGQAEYNLNQALNQLYVAQAAKEQSDKALLIASAQSSQLPSGKTTYIFSGCDIGNYPLISGTASIKKCSDKGYQLSSGYTILYGNCTKAKSSLVNGDIVSFKGYLRDGYIHGVQIDKS